MSAEKLSSDEVPLKFVEWLLTMGYPAEKTPSIDKVTQKCRGQYYMVWRSLMEHVKPKHEVQEKRLKVFCDDVAQCQKKNVCNERNSSVVVPEQLLLWREQAEIQRKVASAENRVKQARDDLNQLIDKISSKISQRDISRRQVEDKQRRVWLLRQVAADLELKKGNLKQTKDIAHSLCDTTHEEDLQGKVDKCLSLIQRGGPPGQLNALNPMASSSAVSSQGDDTEEQLASLARCPGSALLTQLCARRAAIHTTLAHSNTLHSTTNNNKNCRSATQAVLAHTASLHCTLALGAMKNRALVKQTRARFIACIEDINDNISGEACELLVLRCERATTEARVNSLRTLLDELNSNSGVFKVARVSSEPVNGRQISAIDKNIESSRDELKNVIVSLAATERKIYSIRQALNVVFNSFHTQVAADTYRVVQLTFPQDSIATVFQFYSEMRREERRNKADLSMDFDTSECSFDNTIDQSNPRYIDELRIYLKKFCLEKNLKLVTESGEKVWILETLQSSLERLYSRWLNSDVTPLLCPSASLSMNIRRIITKKQMKSVLENIVIQLECNGKYLFDMDLTTKKEQEDAAIDKIKKQIGENLLSLQKSTKMLELGQKNLHLWQDNVFKNYISNNRTVDGKTYREYEAVYIEALTLTV